MRNNQVAILAASKCSYTNNLLINAEEILKWLNEKDKEFMEELRKENNGT